MFHRLLAVAFAAAAMVGSANAYQYNQFSVSSMPEGNKRRSRGGSNMRAIRASRKQKSQKRSKQQCKTSKNRR